MRLHIITPCSRPGWLIPAYRSILWSSIHAQVDITWTLIVTQTERKKFPDLWLGGQTELFICEEFNEGAICEKKLNSFMSKCDIDSETFLWVMSDDNLLPIRALTGIQSEYILWEEEEIDVIVTSHKRGQRRDIHECHDLIANGDNMRMSCCSGEQVFFKRKLFIPWAESSHGDGRFIEHLHATVEDKILYLPNVWTVFDGQKSSRWDAGKINELVFEKGGIGL